MGLDKLSKLFPEQPKNWVKANWWPVRMGTIMGSGEVITIGILISNPEQTKIYQAMRKEVIQFAFRGQGDNFQGKIDFAFKSLMAHIERGGAPDDWAPPFGSLSLGEKRKGAGKDFDCIFNQSASLTASFAELIGGNNG